MKGNFSAIIEKAPEGGYWAICPEVPGANGQGETISAAKQSLRDAIRLMIRYSDNTATNLVVDQIGLSSTAKTRWCS